MIICISIQNCWIWSLFFVLISTQIEHYTLCNYVIVIGFNGSFLKSVLSHRTFQLSLQLLSPTRTIIWGSVNFSLYTKCSLKERNILYIFDIILFSMRGTNWWHNLCWTKFLFYHYMADLACGWYNRNWHLTTFLILHFLVFWQRCVEQIRHMPHDAF